MKTNIFVACLIVASTVGCYDSESRASLSKEEARELLKEIEEEDIREQTEEAALVVQEKPTEVPGIILDADIYRIDPKNPYQDCTSSMSQYGNQRVSRYDENGMPINETVDVQPIWVHISEDVPADLVSATMEQAFGGQYPLRDDLRSMPRNETIMNYVWYEVRPSSDELHAGGFAFKVCPMTDHPVTVYIALPLERVPKALGGTA